MDGRSLVSPGLIGNINKPVYVLVWAVVWRREKVNESASKSSDRIRSGQIRWVNDSWTTLSYSSTARVNVYICARWEGVSMHDCVA